MNRPHFINTPAIDLRVERPRHRRRFRGNIMVDSPVIDSSILCTDVPMSDTPYLPSLDELRQMMHRQPEMSEQKMEEIRRKLNTGEYLTREAAERSAERLLDDGDIQETAAN